MNPDTKRLVAKGIYIAGGILVLPWAIIAFGAMMLFFTLLFFDASRIESWTVPFLLCLHFLAIIVAPSLVITLAIKGKLPWTQKIRSEPAGLPKPLSAAG
jgi:prepilin signal peptidase PulO-like enzyme (type II secretory pathway)